MKRIYILIALFVLGSAAHADNEELMERMQNKAKEKFLIEANTKNSKINELLKLINKNERDGRNDDGIIELPVQASDVKIVEIGQDITYNPYKYSQPENGLCVGGDITGTFLIMLKSRTRVRSAESVEQILFKTSAHRRVEKRILDNSTEVCAELEDESAKYSDEVETIELEDFQISELTDQKVEDYGNGDDEENKENTEN